jgi:hypothetical protein
MNPGIYAFVKSETRKEVVGASLAVSRIGTLVLGSFARYQVGNPDENLH